MQLQTQRAVQANLHLDERNVAGGNGSGSREAQRASDAMHSQAGILQVWQTGVCTAGGDLQWPSVQSSQQRGVSKAGNCVRANQVEPLCQSAGGAGQTHKDAQATYVWTPATTCSLFSNLKTKTTPAKPPAAQGRTTQTLTTKGDIPALFASRLFRLIVLESLFGFRIILQLENAHFDAKSLDSARRKLVPNAKSQAKLASLPLAHKLV